MPSLDRKVYEDRLNALLRSLGISPGSLTARSLLLCAEAEDLLVAEIDGQGREHRLALAAAAAWRAMKTTASSQSVVLQIASAFRSVNRQVEIIRSKLEAGVPLEQILTLSAPPGYSEHHTGRAVDITTADTRTLEQEFENTVAFRWLCENAYSFRFFLSYPRGNPQGYAYEPWHWCFRS